MKLMCSTVVEPSNGTVTSRRFLKSCLTIGRQGNEISLLLQQANKGSKGTKYKIKDNIEKVFTRCVDEGKTTIRLKDPAEDINIRGDSIQLKSFLHVLKLALSEKVNPAVMKLSNLDPKNLSYNKANLVTKVVIKSAANYPVLEGFPRTTKELHLVGLERKSFDRQILKLQSLSTLNLSENQLTSLPQELGMLPNLQELNVANNQLGKSPISKWTWMNGSNVIKNLRLLNLSGNQLKEVPYQLNKLHGLVSLSLNDNAISVLPSGIGNLGKLKYLSIARNYLTRLPGVLKTMRLAELNISENPLQSEMDDTIFCNIKVPSLLDLAAQVVKRRKIYYDASIIPYNLVPILDKANYCLCGLPCFGSFYKKYILGRPNIAMNTKFSGINGNQILYECCFCSARCIRLYSNLQ